MGDLIFDIYFTPRSSGKADYLGRIAVWHANIYLRRRNLPPGDPDHVALEAYCALTATMEITASGLMDPKAILAMHSYHTQLSRAIPKCGVCEDGDMIPMEERFRDAQYTPATPRLSPLSLRWSGLKKNLNLRRDLFEQGLVLKVNRAKMKP